MRRSLLLSVVTLGAAMALASVTGVVAAFTDEVKLGTNSFESGALLRAVDLQIAESTTGGCQTYSDDTVTAPFTLSNLQPGQGLQIVGRLYCLRNVGRMTATVSFRAFDVVDDEVGCSADEAEGDTTCGSGAGELSNLVRVEMMKFGPVGTECSGGGSGPAFSGPTIAQLTTTSAPVAGATLAPGQCMNISGAYLYNPSDADAYKAQTDRVTFSLALNGISA